MASDERISIAESVMHARLSRRTLLIRVGQGAFVVASSGPLSSILAACANGTSKGSQSIAPGGTLHAVVASDPDSLDPQKSSLAVSATIYDGIFSRLVDLQPSGQFTPSVATHWSNPDEKTYVFDLRTDVKFHNGDALTPADVVFTFNRMISKSFGSTYGGEFGAVQSIEPTGASQVTFHLSHPSAPLLSSLANRGHILSERAVGSADPARNPVGTGPFAFDSWIQGQSITLKKHASYFKPGLPHLDGIVFHYLQQDQTRVLALGSGQADWVDGVADQDINSVKANPSLKYVTSSSTGLPYLLIFNVTKPPLNNKVLRQAICWAIDRKQLAQVASLGQAQPGSCEFGSESVWFTQSDPYAAGPNPDMVRSKLAEAGHPNGLSLSIQFAPAPTDWVRLAQVIQQQLKPYGINLTIQTGDIGVWLNRLFKKDYDLNMIFQEQLVDPDGFWSLFYTTTAAENVTGYSNPAVDELVLQAASTTALSDRKNLYAQIRQTVLGDGASLFLIYRPIEYVTRVSVLGSTVTPIQDPDFVNVGFAAK